MALSRDEDAAVEAAKLLERAAECAAVDPGRAGALAVRAAAFLDRVQCHDTLAVAAQLFTAAGDVARAVSAWARAADLAPDDQTRAGDLSNLGNEARQAGRWSRSKAAHRQAYALAMAQFGAESEQAAAAGHNLAVTLKYTGGFAEADRLYRTALNVATASGNNAFAAVICHNLGGLAHARGTPAQGVRWARQGLRLRVKCDPNPLAVAADQGALAALLISTGDHAEAEHLLTRCRATFVELLGPDHYEVAVVEANLANVALARDDLDAAQTYAQHALAIKDAALGPSHPDLAPTLTTLGTIRRRLGCHAAAIALHQRAFDVLAPQASPDHPLLATIRANLLVASDHQPA
jgi:tetratricopeptide (TPR) repeat protein